MLILSYRSVSIYSFMNTAVKSRRNRSQQREETRRQLLDAGLRVVAEHGFVRATTAAIAKATGKAHGTVFLHFPTRDALVSELVEEIGRAMSAQLAALASNTPDVSEVLDAHLAALLRNEALYSCLVRDAPSLPPSARARLFAFQSGVAWRLRTALMREIANGTARDLDPVAISNIWIALTSHYLVNADLFAPGGSVIAERGAQMKAHLLQILRP